MHQCMAGLIDEHKSGLPIKKATDIWASSPTLLEPLSDLWRDNKHLHCQEVTGPTCRRAQVWPWGLARRLAKGIGDRIKERLMSWAYPTDDTTQDQLWRKCPGCRGRKRNDSPLHTRIPGECLQPLVESQTWTCPACVAEKHRGHTDHTYEPGTCRWASAQTRTGNPRTTKGPREPRVPANEERTSHLKNTAGIPNADDATDVKDTSEAQQSEPSSSSSAVGKRGPDKGPRHRDTATAEVGTQLDDDDNTPDWSAWDMGSAIKTFRGNDEGAIRRTLRKLHLRWWHASSGAMKNMLRAAGVSNKVLDHIPSIVDTCRVCRMWTRPTPHAVTTVRLNTQFNQCVQVDLLFWNSFVILHMCDCCIKFSAATIIPDREAQTCINAITNIWFRVHGPPDVLEGDQEGGWARAHEAKTWMARWGTSFSPRAKNQHAWVVERHNEILRKLLHAISSQLKEEKIKVASECILSEALLANNIIISANGTSPYNALYGRVPRMLIDVQQVEGATVDDTTG